MAAKKCRSCFEYEEDEEIEDKLVQACERGHTECVRKIIAQIGTFQSYHWECLSGAMFNASDEGYNDILEMILQVGVNVISDRYPRHWKCVDAANSFWYTPLLRATNRDHIETVKLLLRWGANVNNLTTDKTTALYLAAENGNNKILKVLLEEGANVNPVDIFGWTPLHIAANKVTIISHKTHSIFIYTFLKGIISSNGCGGLESSTVSCGGLMSSTAIC